MKHVGKIKRGGQALMYIAAGALALGLVLASCGDDDGYGGGGGSIYLVSISVMPSSSPPTGSQQFTATGTYSNYVTMDITTLVTWSSSDETVATISNTGLATCTGAVPVTITATYGYISDTATLNCS